MIRPKLDSTPTLTNGQTNLPDQASGTRLRRCKHCLALCAAVTSAVMLLASCQSTTSNPKLTGHTQYIKPGNPVKAAPSGFWDNPSGATGSPKILISLNDQVAYFYIGKTLVGESPISSGKSSTRTPTGTYRVIQKERNHRSSAYGVFKSRKTGEIVDHDAEANNEPTPKGCYFEGADMPYFMRFTGGYGMHAGYLPGYAASHGCVRLPYGMAEKFFAHAPHGTPVIIRHDVRLD